MLKNPAFRSPWIRFELPGKFVVFMNLELLFGPDPQRARHLWRGSGLQPGSLTLPSFPNTVVGTTTDIGPGVGPPRALACGPGTGREGGRRWIPSEQD